MSLKHTHTLRQNLGKQKTIERSEPNHKSHKNKCTTIIFIGSLGRLPGKYFIRHDEQLLPAERFVFKRITYHTKIKTHNETSIIHSASANIIHKYFEWESYRMFYGWMRKFLYFTCIFGFTAWHVGGFYLFIYNLWESSFRYGEIQFFEDLYVGLFRVIVTYSAIQLRRHLHFSPTKNTIDFLFPFIQNGNQNPHICIEQGLGCAYF